MCSALSFKHGTISNFFPPFLRKLSLPCIAISSKVSTQSLEKPGHMTNIFFFPLVELFLKFYLCMVAAIVVDQILIEK